MSRLYLFYDIFIWIKQLTLENPPSKCTDIKEYLLIKNHESYAVLTYK